MKKHQPKKRKDRQQPKRRRQHQKASPRKTPPPTPSPAPPPTLIVAVGRWLLSQHRTTVLALAALTIASVVCILYSGLDVHNGTFHGPCVVLLLAGANAFLAIMLAHHAHTTAPREQRTRHTVLTGVLIAFALVSCVAGRRARDLQLGTGMGSAERSPPAALVHHHAAPG